MDWIDRILDELAAAAHWPYRSGGPAAAEPTAWAAMALAAHGRHESARRAGAVLRSLQNNDGGVGIDEHQPAPHWPTGLAVLAWRILAKRSQADFVGEATHGAQWLLGDYGATMARQIDLGHDTTLVGWSWVEGTHSWVEPTVFAILALKASGLAEHERTREGVRLLIDRLLPEGGTNYGNTFVLGQKLRMHLQPSGLTLLALCREEDQSGGIDRTVSRLAEAVGERTTAASLSYSLMGLAASERSPPQANAWLKAAAERTRRRPCYMARLALVALAAAGEENPLVKLARNGEIQ